MAVVFLWFVLASLPAGCGRAMYDSDLSTRPYPLELHTTETIDYGFVLEGSITLELDDG